MTCFGWLLKTNDYWMTENSSLGFWTWFWEFEHVPVLSCQLGGLWVEYMVRKNKRGERRPRCFSPLWITQPTQHRFHTTSFSCSPVVVLFLFFLKAEADLDSYPPLPSLPSPLPSLTLWPLKATAAGNNKNLRMSTVLQKANAKASADRAVTRRTLSLEEKGGWAKECWPLRRAKQQSCRRLWSKVRTT